MSRKITMIVLIALMMFVAACSGNAGQTEGKDGVSNAAEDVGKVKPPNTSPVELVVVGHLALEAFNGMFGEAIAKKFPYITLKYIPPAVGSELKDLVTAGQTVDLVFGAATIYLGDYNPVKITYDMTPLIKQNKLDLSVFEASEIQEMNLLSGGGLYGLPVMTGGRVMYYNKDIFDKFGVPYPKDGMTWDEALQLAAKVTRNDGGVQYRGFLMSTRHYQLANQFSLPLVDAKTNKSAINNDKWALTYDTLIRKPYAIPGNAPVGDELVSVGHGQNFFTKDRNLAMWATTSNRMDGFPADFNWDMVAMPTFKELPGIGTQEGTTYFSVTSISQHKDQAFDVVRYLMSEEFQRQALRQGQQTTLKDPDIRKLYGQDTSWKDKNIGAVFYNKPAQSPPHSLYDAAAADVYQKYFLKVATGELDVNTALRQSEEEANAKIAELQK